MKIPLVIKNQNAWDIRKEVTDVYEEIVGLKLYLFCIKCGLKEISGDDLAIICPPSVEIIQRAMMDRDARLPEFSDDELSHLANITIGSYSVAYSKDEVVLKCWDKYLDSCIHVCRWINAKEEVMEIREKKKQMLLKYGLPPGLNESTFSSLHEPLKSLGYMNRISCKPSNHFLKPHANIIVLGDDCAGKFTITSNFIHNCSGIDKHSLEIIRKVSQTEITYDQCKFETSLFVVDIKSPGRSDLTQKVMTTTLKADCAVLVVSAVNGISVSNMFRNGQALRHLRSAHGRGVKHLIVAVNKMDTTEPPYSETRFLEIKEEISGYLRKIKYGPHEVPFIPVSGLLGDNIFECSDNFSWFKGWETLGQTIAEGMTLLEALEATLKISLHTDKTLKYSYNIHRTIEPSGDSCDSESRGSSYDSHSIATQYSQDN